MQKSVIEAEIMEYLWPRMGELRKAALVKHLIHGDRQSVVPPLAGVIDS